jgi:hypothetical protein
MDVYSMSDEEVQRLLNERIQETVKNLGKHIDKTFTQHQHFQGTMWIDEPHFDHCRFEKTERRDLE